MLPRFSHLSSTLSRREFCAGVLAATLATSRIAAAESSRFQLNYLVGSSMYGETDLHEILPEVHKTGAAAIDIWPRHHGNQREQVEAMGEEAFSNLLKQNNVRLGCLTQYKLGPFGLQEELKFAQRFGCHTIVTGAVGPKGLAGAELKGAVAHFVEQMQPHLAAARECGVTIAIENHAHNLVDSTDAIKWLMELESSPHLGIALAPSHLPQDPQLLSSLIREIGPRIAVFYAWQNGHGFMTKLPKEEELLQLPGRGELDFGPLLQALKDVNYAGWTEIFMHPTPRGVPILETTGAVTAEINKARRYLDEKLATLT